MQNCLRPSCHNPIFTWLDPHYCSVTCRSTGQYLLREDAQERAQAIFPPRSRWRSLLP